MASKIWRLKRNVEGAITCIRHKKINSERFARDPVLLARPQTIALHQILRHISSSEFIIDVSIKSHIC
ncbi:MAG: hypothetical protein PVG67_08405, partial [Desulfobacterales bacterium]